MKKYIDLAKFHYKRRHGYSFEADCLDFHSEEENIYFLGLLRSAKLYLEYGAGASTIVAGLQGVQTIVIESDPLFMSAVINKLAEKKVDQYVTPVTRRVGLLGPWGEPFISFLQPITPKRALMFRCYSEPPSLVNPPLSSKQCHNSNEKLWVDNLPDLVLIDGRFRVACALKILNHFLQNSYVDYKIIVDDYVSRKQYHILEKFFAVDRKIGELASFSHKKGIDIDILHQTIKKFELIPD